ncbi:hypothetical protein HDU89_004627 [Geranomyces variabilis]|nr:hypothetical protein HDU89_004627 [Geranomyces variabilis]KAJ3166200.1 hypothetical protein HDU88_003423 [Geranomyces variabilis]
MPLQHTVYIKLKPFVTEEQGQDMIQDLRKMAEHPLVLNGSAGANVHSRNRGYQYAMCFSFQNAEDEQAFEHGAESKEFIKKFGMFYEDTIVVDYHF